jgi:hypothetical protein
MKLQRLRWVRSVKSFHDAEILEPEMHCASLVVPESPQDVDASVADVQEDVVFDEPRGTGANDQYDTAPNNQEDAAL